MKVKGAAAIRLLLFFITFAQINQSHEDNIKKYSPLYGPLLAAGRHAGTVYDRDVT